MESALENRKSSLGQIMLPTNTKLLITEDEKKGQFRSVADKKNSSVQKSSSEYESKSISKYS